MKDKSTDKPTSNLKPVKPASGNLHATLTFDLPEDEELLELAIQGRKWRQVVQDIVLFAMQWREEARTLEERNAFRSVNLMLRDYLAELGLSLYTREQQEKMHQDHLKAYAKYWDARVEEANADWRNLMRGEARSDEEPGTGQTNIN